MTTDDRFGKRMTKVMSLARLEAQRLQHEYVGTEHLLLGLVEEGHGVAANVLLNMQIGLEEIRSEVEGIVAGSKVVSGGTKKEPTLTPSAKLVLELGAREAERLGHDHFGTEHLLLGLVGETEGIAAHVLKRRGFELGRFREEIREFLGEDEEAFELRFHPELTPEQIRITIRALGDYFRNSGGAGLEFTFSEETSDALTPVGL